ncbi:MAG: DEAD/DEAH box helicase [Deltaproteobacteria bacterium]|nr:DEAD/DEAH box helicase [Deltaproteobacteria bacterium]
MRAIMLDPGKHDAPRCLSYSDETAVREFEREMRLHRAVTEPFVIHPPGDSLRATWRVQAARGALYDVDLVDGSAGSDTCTCPDFLGGLLGTCKHIHAVLRCIATRPRLSSAWKRDRAERSPPVLGVRTDGGLSLVALGRWPARAMRALGRDADVEVALEQAIARDTLDLAALAVAGVRVLAAVRPAWERLRARAGHGARRTGLVDDARSGRLGLDVLNVPLFPYQRNGVIHLASQGRALLADDMGLGKTVQAIAACQLLRSRGEARSVVVVTPASLKDQWAREISRLAGERAVVVTGNPRARGDFLRSDAAYKVLNYEQTWHELTLLQSLHPDVLVLDEAQRAKNFRTKTSATLRSIPSRFLFMLTGTPVENRLDDLYALMQLVDPEVFGPLWWFNFNFHRQDDSKRGRIQGYRNLGRLRETVTPFVLRRRKEEVLQQLPPLSQQTRYIPLLAEQAEQELAYRTNAAKLAKIAERRPLTDSEQKRLMAALLKARQACDALELLDEKRHGSPKLDELEELLEEITASGAHKVLVFSEWVKMLELAASRLAAKGIGHRMLHGGVPQQHRAALLDSFRSDPAIPVLLSSDAGGVGLNLQEATYVINLDIPWNPGKLDQRTGRAHRLGQTRGVTVIHLCSEAGIERGIDQLLGGKRDLRSAALDADSTAEQLDAGSFALFLKELQKLLTVSELPVVTPPTDVAAVVVDVPAVAAGPGQPLQLTSPPAPSAEPRADGTSLPGRARERLRLARVVLDAGFPADSVRAAYEALATGIRALLPAPAGADHAGLVAAIYTDLMPAGKLAPPAHAALARLHDLTLLDAHGVAVDAALARASVTEAEEWLGRLESAAVS